MADATGIANGTGIALTEEITERINGALAGKKPVTVTYVGLDDRPHMSLRGSTHVHGPDQLAIWVRHASGASSTPSPATPRSVCSTATPTPARPTSSPAAPPSSTTRPSAARCSTRRRNPSATTTPTARASRWSSTSTRSRAAP
ncbi:hypothetical protein ACFQV8_23810 [Pseudonocardia benzenivorans]